MESFRNSIILGSIATYMLFTIMIGIWALRKTKSTQDFFMAGKDLGIFVTGFALFSSLLSGFGFIGGPALVYKMGMSSTWMFVCVIMGFNLSFFLLAKRLRLFAEIGNPISLPDVVKLRYDNVFTQGLMALAIILGVLGYLATQILAMSIVLQEIFNASSFIGSLDIGYCMLISCAILIFYSITGGIVASVYTDLFQGAIMIFGALLIFFSVHNLFEGGFQEISQIIAQDDTGAIGPWGTMGAMGALSWLFVFMMGGAGQPHVITKMMMYKNISDAKYILPTSIIGYFFSALLWLSIGLAMRALIISEMHPELSNADMAASVYLQYYTNPILAGLVFAGLFAAIMSTADAFLNIGTAAIMHDIPDAMGITIKNDLFWARLITLTLTVIAAFFGRYSGDLVAILGAFGWGTFASAIVPVVVIGFNWKRATPLAANVCIISSLLINFSVKIFNIEIPYAIDIGAISLIISMFLFVCISLLSKKPIINKNVEAAMDL